MDASGQCSGFSVYTHNTKMPGCAIKSCKSRSATHNLTNGITFHLFPKNVIHRKKWAEATGQCQSWEPTKTSTICSRHFTPPCFYITKNNRRLLFDYAVPTRYLVPEESVIPLMSNVQTVNSGVISDVNIDCDPKLVTTLNSSAQICNEASYNQSSRELIKCKCPNAVVVGKKLSKLEYHTYKQKRKVRHLQYRLRKDSKKMEILNTKLQILKTHLELSDAEFDALTKTTDTAKVPERNVRDETPVSADSESEHISDGESLVEDPKEDSETAEDPLKYMEDKVKSELESE